MFKWFNLRIALLALRDVAVFILDTALVSMIVAGFVIAIIKFGFFGFCVLLLSLLFIGFFVIRYLIHYDHYTKEKAITWNTLVR